MATMAHENSILDCAPRAVRIPGTEPISMDWFALSPGHATGRAQKRERVHHFGVLMHSAADAQLTSWLTATYQETSCGTWLRPYLR
jgi:hypothetical protein